MVTLVYKYGALRPWKQDERTYVEQQLRGGHTYQNQLVALERDHLAEIRDTNKNDPHYACLLAQDEHMLGWIDNTAKEIKQLKQRARGTAKQATAALKEQLATLKALHKELRAPLREAKKAAIVAQKEAVEIINKQYNEKRKELRAKRPCHWGTGGIIEQAVQASFSKCLKSDDSLPHFKRWTGEGTVGIQISSTQPLTTEGALACQDLRLQIMPPTVGKKPKTLMRVRLGTVEKRVPLFIDFPVKLHRPLPPKARICWVKVIKKKIADHTKWEVHLTLKIDQYPETCGQGTVAVDLRWRKVDTDTYLVACWRDNKDNTGELVLPQRVVSGLKKANELQSLRNKLFNDLQQELLGWKKYLVDVPLWLKEATSHLHVWKSWSQISTLVKTWTKQADPQWQPFMKHHLICKLKHDRHLWQWEAHQRRKSLEWRRDVYRKFAARLARQYDTVVLEDFDLARMKQRVCRDPDKYFVDQVQNQMFVCAPGELRATLVQAFGVRGGKEEWVHSAGTSKQCSECDHKEQWDQSREWVHRCSNCGALWGQGENATANLLLNHTFKQHTQTAKHKKTYAEKQQQESKWKKVRESSRDSLGV